MKFKVFNQLSLLLWKNFRLRKRRRLPLIFEIITPLFILFILVAVRNANLKFRMDNCNLKEKQMASMGPVPFLRDFMCTFNTSCYNKSHITWGEYKINDFQIFVKNISNVYSSLPSGSLTVAKFLEWNSTHPVEAKQLEFSMKYISNVTAPLMLAMKQAQSTNESQRNEGIKSLGNSFCGSSENDMNGFLRMFMKKSKSKRSIATCQAEFKMFLGNNSMILPIYNDFAPLIFGKIYFTPNSPFTRELIKRANVTFRILDDLRLTAIEWRLHFKSWFLDTMMNNEFLNELRLICLFRTLSFCEIISMNNITSLTTSLSDVFMFIENTLNCTVLDKFVPLQSPLDIDNLSNSSMKNIFAAVVFDENLQYITTNNATFLNYKIRMSTNRVDTTLKFKVLDKFWTPYPRTSTFGDLKYYTSGFLLLQEAIDQAFIEMITGNESINVGSSMQIMPYPCYVIDKFSKFLSNMIPFLLIIAWGSSVSNLIKSIVYEKENRLKEFMRVMGLSNLVHWLGWFISTIMVLIFPVTIMALILKYGKILEFSSPGVVFIVLLTYVISFICQAFMISVFFDKANVASVSGGIIYFICYMPFLLFVNLQDSMTVIFYYLFGLLTQVSFANSINFIAYWEQTTDGAQFSNLFKGSIIDLNFGVGHCIVMMWIDSVIYLLITWYVEAVFPGQFGIGKPWYFLFTRQYWVSDIENYNNNDNTPLENRSKNNSVDNHGFEPEPVDLKIGISIKDLVKIYSKSKIPAVDRLNLNFYQSQITAFLGHNGAGKTTTISILTGIYPPTSGTAFVLNQDIRTNIDEIRENIGLCPQHNILFDTLTIEDHIYFYGLLKGMNKEEIREILPKIVEEVGLTKKINSASKKLSGGMKRKLSVAMAFIGNSRIVFLDEPTAGVDPFARRGIWDLLIKYRNKDRTIILTTHHMDEADYLSDRIAIISQGKLQCCGSSVFLKKVFGNGYYLILIRDEHVDEDEVKENGISKSGEKVLSFIRKHICDAQMIEETKTQWTIVLPQNDANCKQFSSLFARLDQSMENLKVVTYGLSDTSLEEVFLKVANDPSGVLNKTYDKKITQDSLDSLTDDGNLPRPVSIFSLQSKADLMKIENLASMNLHSNNRYILLTGLSLLRQQILGLQIKRFHYTKRNVKGFIAELILPVLVILLMIILLKISNPMSNQPSMVISPWLMMPKARMTRLNTFYRKENISNKLIDSLESGYRSNLGESGVRCMNPSVYQLQNYPCYPEKSKNGWSAGPQGPIPLITPECDCKSTGYQTCTNPLSGGPPESYRIMTSSDKLSNLTGYNISDYLMKNFKKFVKKQYGGYQFLLPSNYGQSSKLIGISPIWDGTREMIINSSQTNSSNLESLKFLNYFQEFFNLSGIKTNFTRIWINSKGYASMPAYANIFSNLLLRSRINSSQHPSNYGISVANYPLKYSQSDLRDQMNRKMFLEVSLAVFVIFGLSFIPASFVIFLIEERVSGSKRQQFVSGVNPYVYWVSNFCWDIVKYIFPVMIVLLIFVAFNYQSYIGSRNIGAFITILLFYGLAIIPHMYPFSFLISTPSTAFVILNAYNLLIGSISTIATFILDMLEQDDGTLKPINDILKKVFLVFPQYDLGRGMMDLSFNYLKYENSGGQIKYKPFDWDTTGEKLFALVVLFIGWWIVICIIESGLINRALCGKLKNFKLKSKEIRCEEDIDVTLERERMKIADNRDILKVINLTKIYNPSWNISNNCFKKAIKNNLYSARRKVAVNNICFGVKEGECFGLLGVNGAGKTTTFKMLTGEEDITYGDAMINGNSIISDMIGAHQDMGFCPQFDALHALLTCEEQLYFYCRIRGIEFSQIKSTVELSLKNLSLFPHATKITQTLSGGNKRKLSTAIALIGSPKVIFLDEPTSGMDAGARRFLWNVIRGLTNESKISVILTSHNMEECEVLCHRLSIMVNGEMKCLGSVQHLKSKFGDYYYVNLRIRPDEQIRNKIKNIMDNQFPYDAILKDENFVTLQYQFGSSSKLSIIFDFFENLKAGDVIVDYSVSQTTLDDVFINFAKQDVPSTFQDMSHNSCRFPREGYVNESYEKSSLIPGRSVDIL